MSHSNPLDEALISVASQYLPGSGILVPDYPRFPGEPKKGRPPVFLRYLHHASVSRGIWHPYISANDQARRTHLSRYRRECEFLGVVLRRVLLTDANGFRVPGLGCIGPSEEAVAAAKEASHASVAGPGRSGLVGAPASLSLDELASSGLLELPPLPDGWCYEDSGKTTAGRRPQIPRGPVPLPGVRVSQRGRRYAARYVLTAEDEEATKHQLLMLDNLLPVWLSWCYGYRDPSRPDWETVARDFLDGKERWSGRMPAGYMPSPDLMVKETAQEVLSAMIRIGSKGLWELVPPEDYQFHLRKLVVHPAI